MLSCLYCIWNSCQ